MDAMPPDRAAESRNVRSAVAVHEQRDVELLVLAAVARSPRTVAEIAGLAHERSGGLLTVSPQLVRHRLSHLARNRLVRRTAGSRYRSTPSGRRILAGRTRRWQTLVRGLETLLGA